MLFLLGQRAAKIALHDLQDRALVVGQTQPLGFAPRPYDPTGLALDGLSAASTTSAHVFALACFISASVRLASNLMRRRSRSVSPPP